MNWERIEPGWYTSAAGGIAEEKDGKWYVYPRQFEATFGPFKTLAEPTGSRKSPVACDGARCAELDGR